MSLWALGFLAGGIVVLVLAALLIGIIWQAKRILRLANAAALAVGEIDVNTRSVWALRDTNSVAMGILEGARAIDTNAAAIANAVAGIPANRNVA
jgi:hypothetical protein